MAERSVVVAPKPDYAAGLKILRKVAEDERNWRSGMSSIGDLLEVAQAAEARLREIDDLDSKVKILKAEFRDVQSAIRANEEKARAAREESTRLLGENAQARKELFETQAALRDFRELPKIRAELVTLRAEREQFQGELGELGERAEIQTDLERLRAQRDAIQRDIDALRAKHGLGAQVAPGA